MGNYISFVDTNKGNEIETNNLLCVNDSVLNYQLCKYAMTGNLDSFKELLLNKDVDINYQYPTAKYSVLHCASGNGYHNIVQYMVKDYKDKLKINCVNSTNRTPLHFASRIGNIPCIKLLIEYKAEINIQDCDGETCLHYCARLNHIEAIKFLLNSGANKDIKDNKGKKSIDLAIEENNSEIIQILISM